MHVGLHYGNRDDHVVFEYLGADFEPLHCLSVFDAHDDRRSQIEVHHAYVACMRHRGNAAKL